MNFEKIRVNSRVKLIGRLRTGNMLVLFSVCLRIALYTLTALVLLRFGKLYTNEFGRVILGACAVALCSGILLLWCVRTVKDRWYAAISEGCYVSVTDLVVRFTLRDVLNSVKCSVIASFLSLIRVILFCSFPTAFAVFILNLMRDGVSCAVFGVLMFGFTVLLICSVFFLSVSLGCVSLARSFCFCSTNKFMTILKSLEKSCFRIMAFSLLLSVFNRCSRRFSKIEFARFVALCDYTLL